MKIKIVFLFIIGSFFNIWSQTDGTIKATIDSTRVLIGAQLNYTLQVKADTNALVVFPEKALFTPFEILEESPIDTLRAQSHYLYTKRYALIQFDSGRYVIPQQQVLVNGFSKIADTFAIEVLNVAVDTLKQPLYDIKPIQEVEKNYDALISRIVWGLLIFLIVAALVYVYFFQKRRKELREQALPPFDRALGALKALEAEKPTAQEEYKMYYSRMTDVVRRYLEEEAKISAMESTSDELLLKLEALKAAGKLELESATIKRLRAVLQTADLVKFAKELPDYGVANNDRKAVENVVIETQEALPEPTEEELREQAAYKLEMQRKRRKERLAWAGAGSGILALLTLLGAMAIYGYYPVMDTLMRYPTKVLIGNQWVESQYGTPPLNIATPEVLERIAVEGSNEVHFVYGNMDEPFFIDVHFNMQRSQKGATTEPQAANEEQQASKGQELINGIITNFEAKGAVNILIKDDEVTLASGIPALKIYGTLDYPRRGAKERIRTNYTTLLFAFQEGTITVTMMYAKEDRYGAEIEGQITNSLDLIKAL